VLPPIRYPLPTLIAVVLLGTLAWTGEALTRPLRAAIARRWSRTFEGPPVPSSTHPRVVAGPITRKGLLLHDDVTVTRLPGGAPADTISRRMFVDIYDVWPLRGEPTHYRVGNRRPFGWVRAGDLIAWDTRLVVQLPRESQVSHAGPQGPFTAPAPEGRRSLPVMAWTAEAVEVVSWVRDRPWGEVDRRAWVRLSDLPHDRWGVWLSRDELLVLLRHTLDPAGPAAPEIARLQAVLGRFAVDHALVAEDVPEARAALPRLVFEGSGKAQEASECLARVNEHWLPEASWSGVSFQSIPLSCLP
jgi:hypothetical protein